VWHSMEADQRNNSNYLFNIGHSKGLQQQVSGLNSSDTCSGTMGDVGFTIDATKYGNVGRFINHNCSPNLFAQIVLSNYGDKRVPHVMFFAMETIPPLQELTCKYK
jgi:SET domain-containing protein